MIFLANSFACLVEVVILLPVSALTIKKLYQGSKSNFAYILLAFTYADVINRLAYLIIYIFPDEKVHLPNG